MSQPDTTITVKLEVMKLAVEIGVTKGNEGNPTIALGEVITVYRELLTTLLKAPDELDLPSG